MEPVNPPSPLEEHADLLAEWHDILVTGGTTILPVPPEWETNLQPRVQRFQASLQLLERIRQRHGAELLTVDLDPDPVQQVSKTRQLDRFQVRARLGSGAHGVVFRAFDPRAAREVALKLPRPQALLVPDLRDRFLREARTAASLDHPHIVPLYEVGEVGSLTFLAYAYIPGPNLAQWLEQQPSKRADWKTAVGLVADLTAAVGHLHARGIVHRDLKPSNVLMQPCSDGPNRWTPRLTDFGLARLADDPVRLTRTGTLLGTPAYMAPEQATGKSTEVGAAADLYSLGAILHELLTGRTPFEGGSDVQILHRLTTQEVIPFRRDVPGIPLDVETICLKCLAREPADRYRGAAELEADLRAAHAERPIRARRQRWPERLLRQLCRRPRTVALCVLCFIAFIVAVVWGELRAIQRTKLLREREWQGYVRALPGIQHLLDQGDGLEALEQLNALRPDKDAPDLRNFEWRLLQERCRRAGLRFRLEPGANVLAAACSQDGNSLLTGDSKGFLKYWNARTGALRWQQDLRAPVEVLAIARTGSSIFTRGADGRIQHRDATDGHLIEELGEKPEGKIVALAEAPVGPGVYCATDQGEIFQCNSSTRTTQVGQSPHFTGLSDLATAGPGRKVLASDVHRVLLFDAKTLQYLRHHWLDGPINRVCIRDRDGLVSAGGEDFVALVDGDDLHPRSILRFTTSNVRDVCMPWDGTDLTIALNARGQPEGQVEFLDSRLLVNPAPEELRRAGTRVSTFGRIAFARSDGGARYFAVAASRSEEVFFVGAFAKALAVPDHADPPSVRGVNDGFVQTMGLAGRPGSLLRFGGSAVDDFQAVAAGPDRTAVAVGRFSKSFRLRGVPEAEEKVTCQGKDDVLVCCIGSDPKRFRWQRCAGGAERDEARGVAVDEHGVTYVTGFCGADCSFPGKDVPDKTSSPGSFAWVWKILPNGETAWVRRLPMRSQGQAVLVVQKPQLAVNVAGFAWTKDNSTQPFLWRLNDAGETLAMHLTPIEQGPGRIHQLVHDLDGDLWIVGHFSGTVDLALFGHGPRLTNPGKGEAAFITKLDARGRNLWTCMLPEVGPSCRVASGPGGSTYVSGHCAGQLKLPGGEVLHAPPDQDHAFCLMLDAHGNTAWSWQLEGSGESFLDAMTVDGTGQIWLGGRVAGEAIAHLDGRRIKNGEPGAVQRTFIAQIRPVVRSATPWTFSAPINTLAWSPGNRSLFVGGQDQLAELRSLDQRIVEVSTRPEEAWAVAFSPDSQSLAVGCDTEEVPFGLRLYQAETGQLLWQVKDHPALVTAVAFTPDGKTLVSGGFDWKVRLHDAATGKLLDCLTGHTGSVRCLAVSPDGRLAASGGKDRTIQVYDLTTREVRRALRGHEQQVMAVTFTPDSRTLISTSTDGTVRFWDPETGSCTRTISNNSGYWGLACSPSGRYLATGTHEGRIRLLDLHTQKERVLSAHPTEIRSLAFTPDEQRLISAGEDALIRIWDFATLQPLLTLRGHQRPVHGLAFSPDGTILASAGLDGVVRLWHAPQTD